MARKNLLSPSEPEESNLGTWAAQGCGQAVTAGQKRYPWGGGYNPNVESPRSRSQSGPGPIKTRGGTK